jgi:hypothetical protein
MYLTYKIDQIHQLLNESKKRIISYKQDRREYKLSRQETQGNSCEKINGLCV